MLKNFKYLLFIFIFTYNFTLVASDKITIGISKASGSESYENYPNWLRKLDSNIIIIDFYQIGLDSISKALKQIDGLLLSGGPDLHPKYYGKPDYEHLCSIDSKRDSLEIELIKSAIKKKIPIFGICRGLQVLNVALGGTLIADIPTQYKTDLVHQDKNSYEVYHNIEITDSKVYKKIFGYLPTNLEVNSNHHQAIDKLSKKLIAIAKSRDGIIEMFTWKRQKNNSFLIAVQWHPERLFHKNIELSDKLGIKFINEIRKNKKKKR